MARDSHQIFFLNPDEDRRPVCLACLRAVQVDPYQERLKEVPGPCWACRERREVMWHGALANLTGRRVCLVCGLRARTPVQLLLGARRSLPLGYLCRRCLKLSRELTERRGRTLHTV